MEDHDTERAMLFGLLIECPFMNCREDCPIEDRRRSLTREEKIEFIEGLNDEEVGAILEHHRACLARREGRGTT